MSPIGSLAVLCLRPSMLPGTRLDLDGLPSLNSSADTTSTIIRRELLARPCALFLLLLLMQGECQSSLQPMGNPPPIHPHRPLLACLAAIRVSAMNQSSSLDDKGGGQPRRQGKAYLQPAPLSSLRRRLIILQASVVCASPLAVRSTSTLPAAASLSGSP